MHLKHFFLRERLVYLLCSVFLNNLWTKETTLIYPRGFQATEQVPHIESDLSPWGMRLLLQSPTQKDVGTRQRERPAEGPSSWAGKAPLSLPILSLESAMGALARKS